MWYAVAATIGAFMLANLVRIAFHHLRRRSGVKSVASMSEKNEFAAPPQSSTLTSIPNKAAGAINKHVLWRDFAIKLWIRVPVGEAFFSLAYTAAILVLGFIYSESHPIRRRTCGKDSVPRLTWMTSLVPASSYWLGCHCDPGSAGVR